MRTVALMARGPAIDQMSRLVKVGIQLRWQAPPPSFNSPFAA